MKKPKFKVGDRVRINPFECNESIGKIKKIKEGEIKNESNSSHSYCVVCFDDFVFCAWI